jgi:hypothetical protein
MPRATTRGAIAVRTTHLVSPSPRENKMEIANLVLPVFGIGGSLSSPLGSLLVALAGYTPHIRLDCSPYRRTISNDLCDRASPIQSR